MRNIFAIVLTMLVLSQSHASEVKIQDVTVPYPGADSSDYIFVTGTPGSSQPEKFCVAAFLQDQLGRPIHSSERSLGCAKIGTGIRATGTSPVVIAYDGVQYIANKISGLKLAVELKKIQVPQPPSNISYKVLLDFTSAEMQDTALAAMWVSTSNKGIEDYYCRARGPAAQKVCRAIRQDNYKLLKDAAIIFNSDASYQIIKSDDSIANLGPDYLTRNENENFVSVLPGVYGIEWLDSNSNELSLTLGIVVK